MLLQPTLQAALALVTRFSEAVVYPLAKFLSLGFNQIVITKLQPTACELQLSPLGHGPLASVDWLYANKSKCYL